MSANMSGTKQGTTRRGFLETSGAAVAGVAVAGAGACGVAAPPEEAAERNTNPKRQRETSGPMMQLAEILPPPVSQVWRLAKQCGASFVVGSWGRSPKLDVPREQLPWSYDSLARLKETYEREEFKLAVLECRPPTNKIKLGLSGRDDEIEVSAI